VAPIDSIAKSSLAAIVIRGALRVALRWAGSETPHLILAFQPPIAVKYLHQLGSVAGFACFIIGAW